MKTFSAKPSDIEQNWYVVDAKGKVLGRLATSDIHDTQGQEQADLHPPYGYREISSSSSTPKR